MLIDGSSIVQAVRCAERVPREDETGSGGSASLVAHALRRLGGERHRKPFPRPL